MRHIRSFVARVARAITLLAGDARIPKPLRWIAASGRERSERRQPNGLTAIHTPDTHRGPPQPNQNSEAAALQDEVVASEHLLLDVAEDCWLLNALGVDHGMVRHRVLVARLGSLRSYTVRFASATIVR